MERRELFVLTPVPDAPAPGVRARRTRKPDQLPVYVERVSKAVGRHCGPNTDPGRFANCSDRDGWRFVAASYYTALCVYEPADTLAAAYAKQLPLRPGRLGCEAGDWLKVELKAAIARLRETWPKPRDLERHMRVCLALSGPEAHVAQDELETDSVLVNPKYLLDGLGRYPAVIRWTPQDTYLCVDSNEARYYVALIAYPALTL